MGRIEEIGEKIIQLLALSRLAVDAEEIARFSSAPEWVKWRERFADVFGYVFESEAFIVEVKFAREPSSLWIKSGKPRTSLETARAVVEDLRTNHGHGNSAIRIMQGEKMVQLILPGDAPVAELEK